MTARAEPQAGRPRVAGLLLAAGAGIRYGQPKALVDTGSGPWVRRGIEVLANCDPVLVVLGASSAEVAAVVPRGVRVVLNPDFSAGLGSSLRVGLAALGTAEGTGLAEPTAGESADDKAPPPVGSTRPIDAALVMLVDLPGIGPAVVDRVLAATGSATQARSCLARAAFAGVPGHPVLLGSDHWAGVIDAAIGDRGARDYLRRRQVKLVECGDIGSGQDVDVRGWECTE